MSHAPAAGGTRAARALRFAKFGLVGLSGYVVNTAALAVFTDIIGIHYLGGATLATQVSTTWNYVFTDGWVYGAATPARAHVRRFGLFWMMNNGALLLRLPMIWALTEVLSVHHLISNIISLGIITLLRFWASDSYIWAGSN